VCDTDIDLGTWIGEKSLFSERWEKKLSEHIDNGIEAENLKGENKSEGIKSFLTRESETILTDEKEFSSKITLHEM